MALAVASTSSLTIDPRAASGVITKPTGVAVGDLLLILAVTSNSSTPDVACTGFSSSIEHLVSINRACGLEMLWKVADSGDVSASNYTVTGTLLGGLFMMRVTGWTGAATLNPTYLSATGGTQYSTGTAQTNTQNISLAPPTEQLIIMALGAYGQSDTVFNTPTLTPSAPSFTTLGPILTQNVANTENGSFQVYYGIRSATTEITQYTFVSDNSNSDPQTVISFLSVIAGEYNQTGTNALLEVSPTIFTNTAVEVGGTGTNALLEVEPEMFEQSGDALQPTPWTTIQKS